jgi:uncharacterized protein with ATP-grasp and redox domains
MSRNKLEPFVLLKDPATYVACSTDLCSDAVSREYWITFFKKHLTTILGLGVESARGSGDTTAEARADACRDELWAFLDRVAAAPEDFGRVTILSLDEWRDQYLRKHGFVDCFSGMKDRENAAMLPLLPVVCRELDGLKGMEQLAAVVKGVFAGNIFDMGAGATAERFLGKSPDFFATRNEIAPRPWLVDDFDALANRMLNGPVHRKAVFFVDNAGSDFLLGAAPMMRWLAQRGTEVILAANERPTLNDMTIHDVRKWWGPMVEAEPSLGRLPIRQVSTGTGEPLIDLSRVSPELNDAARGADLVIIEGMGRGVESNLDAEFVCDALNIAMIKDPDVARHLNGKVYDVVCRFR